LFGGGGGEALAEGSAARVDPDLPARLRVDEPQLADVGKLLLARVADLDRQYLVPAHQLEQRLAPVEWPTEVGHDHDDPALPRDRAGAVQRLSQRRDAYVLLFRLALQRGEQPDQSRASLRRGQRRRVRVAERRDPEPVAAPRCDVAG